MSQSNNQRETFSSRKAFIIAAIGSAVGLGNIWRFPYVTYENGGGAFVIPYIIALLTAGIPLLFLDYAIGHRHRGGAPLSYRRFNRHFETFGWWQVMVNVIIGIYYAVILGWAASYTYFSINGAWGDKPIDFFIGEFLRMGDINQGVSFEFVSMVTGPLIAVWLVALGVLALGVQKGIAKSSGILMPLLIIMFIILVISALFLPKFRKRSGCVIYSELVKIIRSKCMDCSLRANIFLTIYLLRYYDHLCLLFEKRFRFNR